MEEIFSYTEWREGEVRRLQVSRKGFLYKGYVKDFQSKEEVEEQKKEQDSQVQESAQELIDNCGEWNDVE